jgi:hypothetical protein
MISHVRIRIAAIKIIQIKREKNRALANDQKPPKFTLSVSFREFEKEILGLGVRPDACLLDLEQGLKSMVAEKKLVPVRGEFTLPEVIAENKLAVELNWGTK